MGVVTLQQELLPPPEVETHVAAQEVLVTTFEQYEDSVGSAAVVPAAFGGSEGIPRGDGEEDHLLKFVRERRNAAKSEVNFVLRNSRGSSGRFRAESAASQSNSAASESSDSSDDSSDASSADSEASSSGAAKSSLSSEQDLLEKLEEKKDAIEEQIKGL